MNDAPSLARLGALIRHRRRALALTQSQLGSRIEWTQARTSLLERGGYGLPSLIILARLATALETPLADLLSALGYQVSSPIVQHQTPGCAALLFTLEGFLEMRGITLAVALEESCDLAARVMGADIVEVYLHDQPAGQLVSSGCGTSPLARREQALGLDWLGLVAHRAQRAEMQGRG